MVLNIQIVNQEILCQYSPVTELVTVTECVQDGYITPKHDELTLTTDHVTPHLSFLSRQHWSLGLVAEQNWPGISQ